MRTLRLSLAGTIIVTLLITVCGASMAQDKTTWPQLDDSIPYGEEDPSRQIIHAYRLEPREAPRPAIVSFHGGGFQAGNPLSEAVVVQHLATKGFVVFLPGYRLYEPGLDDPNAWPTQLEDAQRVIRWVRAHAEEFNVDPDRVCAGGYSAGGHLAALLGTMDTLDDSDPELAGISSRPDCVLMLAGDGDLTVPDRNEEMAEDFAGYYGGSLADRPELWEAASPAHHVDDHTPPFLILHGTNDEMVSVESARNLVAALTEAGRDVEYVELPADHFSLRQHEDYWPTIVEYVVARMRPEE